MRSIATAAWITLFIAHTAAAQPAPPAPQLLKFIQDPANQAPVFELMRQQSAGFPQGCTAVKLPSERLAVQQPPHFDAAGKPRDGLWKESFSGDRCGTPITFNVVTRANADGTIERAAMLPGSSLADFVLQRDAMQQAATGVGLALRDCRDQFVIIDTAFVAYAAAQPKIGAGGDTRAWTEHWVAAACGKHVTLTMHFTPDATGTGVNVANNETTVR